MRDSRETGQPRVLPGLTQAADYTLFWAYLRTGQTDAAVALFDERFIQTGNYGAAAEAHAWYGTDELLGDDPRYQALLEEAGITW